MLMDPDPSQQHGGLHAAVWRPQQEVTRGCKLGRVKNVLCYWSLDDAFKVEAEVVEQDLTGFVIIGAMAVGVIDVVGVTVVHRVTERHVCDVTSATEISSNSTWSKSI